MDQQCPYKIMEATALRRAMRPLIRVYGIGRRGLEEVHVGTVTEPQVLAAAPARIMGDLSATKLQQEQLFSWSRN
jgi:hypothetical protein